MRFLLCVCSFRGGVLTHQSKVRYWCSLYFPAFICSSKAHLSHPIHTRTHLHTHTPPHTPRHTHTHRYMTLRACVICHREAAQHLENIVKKSLSSSDTNRPSMSVPIIQL